jgi:cytochrome P450
VLSILIDNQDQLDLPHEVVVREVAFYLLAGAHTSATAFTRVSHNIFRWLEAHPDDDEAVRHDRLFVQRCTHETVRLQPSSPVAMRWALDDIELKSGRRIPAGSKVVIDLL